MNQLKTSFDKLSISKHKNECKILFFQATEKGDNVPVEDTKDITVKYSTTDIQINIRKLKFKFNPGSNKVVKIVSLLTDEYGIDVLDENDENIRVDF
jgi:hypothetical protein